VRHYRRHYEQKDRQSEGVVSVQQRHLQQWRWLQTDRWAVREAVQANTGSRQADAQRQMHLQSHHQSYQVLQLLR
jgi:hypothetical protein